MTDTQKLDLILSKLENIDSKIEKLENRMEHMEARMDRIETRMDSMEARTEHIETGIGHMKIQIGTMEARIVRMDSELLEMKNKLNGIGLHLENKTDWSIRLLAENHSNLIDHLNQAIPSVSKNLVYEVKVNYLIDEMEKMKKDIEVLKNRIA